MVKIELTLTVKLAWWVMPYVQTLILFCKLMNTEPDMDKVEKIIHKGLIVGVMK